MLNVPIQQLEHALGLELPAYQTSGAAGLDLVCALEKNAPVTLEAGQTALIPTGLVVEIPNGFEAQVRPRSGLAFKHGITVLNAPGTIDSDYRGELKVLLINHGSEDFMIERGMRIAQLVIAPVTQIEWQQTTTYTQTKRAGGGFGSSGV